MWIRLTVFILLVCFFNAWSVNDTSLCSRYYESGNKFYSTSRFDSALFYYKSALANCNSENNADQYALIISSIGNVYEDLSDYQKAMDYYRNSMDIYKSALNNEDNKIYKTGMSNSLNQIGNIYYRWGDYENALKYYEDGLKIKNEINDIEGIPSSYNNIGNIYYSWQKRDKALEYYLKALDLKQKQGDKNELPNYLINIGSAYLSLKNYDNARKYYNDALKISHEQNNKHMETSCLINIGVLNFENSDYSSALKYYEEAYKLVIELGSTLEQAYILRNMGETYLALNDLDKARENIDRSLELAENENLKALISEIYYFRYIIYQKENRYKEALVSYVRYSELNDSIFNEESRKKLNDLLSKYEYEKKDLEIEKKNIELSEKQRKIQQQRLIYISIILLIVVIALFIYFMIRSREIRKRNMLESELNKQMQKSLSAQMNPHFISNALNSIQKFFLKNDIEKANEYLSDFGSLIRSILENSRKFKIPLSDELQSLQLYINLEQMRLENKFTYTIEVESSIDQGNTYIPSMIIQPYVENSIWHGIAPMSEKNGHISIVFRLTNNNLICEITDNGIGLKKSEELKNQYKKKHRSLGMSINKERLDLLNKSGKTNFSVSVIDMSDAQPDISGTRVELIINISDDGKN